MVLRALHVKELVPHFLIGGVHSGEIRVHKGFIKESEASVNFIYDL